MPRPRFTVRALLVPLLAIACFFGGIRFERERQRRADRAAMKAQAPTPKMFPNAWGSWPVLWPDGRTTFVKKPKAKLETTEEE